MLVNLLGLRQGSAAMQNAWCKGFRKIVFEGYNNSIAKLIDGNVLDFGVLNWIREARLWKNRFAEVQLQWTKREFNRLADHLAKQQFIRNHHFFYHSYVPISISHLLHDDFRMTL